MKAWTRHDFLIMAIATAITLGVAVGGTIAFAAIETTDPHRFLKSGARPYREMRGVIFELLDGVVEARRDGLDGFLTSEHFSTVPLV
jgi:hypothetical protein